MNVRKFFFVVTIACFFLAGFSSVITAQNITAAEKGKAKYVFLFIGDGMGLAQVATTQAYLSALDGQIGMKPLSFTSFPGIGLATTYANNQLTTCSAAAGTALATGHKTNIGRISMDPDAKDSLISIATKAHNMGMKVGVVTSTSIDHATPSVFYAHQSDREMYFEIGEQLARSDFDFFAGGGFMKPTDTIDGKIINLIDDLINHGYTITDTKEEFAGLKPGAGKALVISPVQADEASLPFTIDMNPEDITLADFTGKAIEMLSGENGFFLMVESGKVDWACHENDAASSVHEVLALDRAVTKAVEFYKQHPQETIIVVTADHETGGLALGNKKMEYETNIGLLRYQKISLVELTKIVISFREKKSGNADADYKSMLKVLETDLGLNSKLRGTELSDKEKDKLKDAFMESVYGEGSRKEKYSTSDPFSELAVELLNKKAGLSWASKAHTAIPVPVYSTGVGFEKFSGYIDNTDIPKLLEGLMGIEE